MKKAPHKITLKYSTGKKLIMDTTMVVNGAFSFSGQVQYPVRASLYLLPLLLPRSARWVVLVTASEAVCLVAHITIKGRSRAKPANKSITRR